MCRQAIGSKQKKWTNGMGQSGPMLAIDPIQESAILRAFTICEQRIRDGNGHGTIRNTLKRARAKFAE